MLHSVLTLIQDIVNHDTELQLQLTMFDSSLKLIQNIVNHHSELQLKSRCRSFRRTNGKTTELWTAGMWFPVRCRTDEQFSSKNFLLQDERFHQDNFIAHGARCYCFDHCWCNIFHHPFTSVTSIYLPYLQPDREHSSFFHSSYENFYFYSRTRWCACLSASRRSLANGTEIVDDSSGGLAMRVAGNITSRPSMAMLGVRPVTRWTVSHSVGSHDGR